MKSTESLRKALDKALLGYIHKFELIHGVEHEFSVNDDLMGAHCFGDYFFNMVDIVYDIDEKLPINMIFAWQDATISAHFAGNKETINLHSYAKGLRYEGGGHFNYQQTKLKDIIDEINEVINNNDNDGKNEYGDQIGHGYNAETINRFKIGVRALEIAYVYTQRIDWLLSCDDGEDSFHTRLTDDLHKLQKTGEI